MEIKQYTIADFRKLNLAAEFSDPEVVPITPPRVISQIHNPKALPDDVVLSVAEDDNGRILGYIGALPDNLEGEHCAWNSCWWVKKGAPAEVSMKLLFTFISNWNKKLLFSEMTPHTSKIIEALGIARPYTIIGFRGYLRFNMAEILPQKKAGLVKLKGVLKIIDFLVNLLINFIVLFQSSAKTYLRNTVVVDELTVQDEAFIRQHNHRQPAKRSREDFNWISQYSWLVNRNVANEKIVRNYYFSYAVTRFESKWVRFTENDQMVALVNYTIRDNALKLPYVYLQPDSVSRVANYFYRIMLKDNQLVSITTFHQELAEYFHQKKTFVFKTRLPKYSAISNALYEAVKVDDPVFQMGDGDCVFT